MWCSLSQNLPSLLFGSSAALQRELFFFCYGKQTVCLRYCVLGSKTQCCFQRSCCRCSYVGCSCRTQRCPSIPQPPPPRRECQMRSTEWRGPAGLHQSGCYCQDIPTWLSPSLLTGGQLRLPEKDWRCPGPGWEILKQKDHFYYGTTCTVLRLPNDSSSWHYYCFWDSESFSNCCCVCTQHFTHLSISLNFWCNLCNAHKLRRFSCKHILRFIILYFM